MAFIGDANVFDVVIPSKGGFMKRTLALLILLFVAVCLTPNFSHAADGFTGNINFLIGKKVLNENDWTPYDSQTEYGVGLDVGGATWPVHVEVAYLSASDDQDISGYDPDLGDVSADAEACTTELRLGAKYIWDSFEIIRPYVAAGIASIKGEVEVDVYGFSESMDDSAVGLYLTGGLYWTIAEHFNVGAEAGYSFANIDLSGYEVDAGGLHALALIGYHF